MTIQTTFVHYEKSKYGYSQCIDKEISMQLEKIKEMCINSFAVNFDGVNGLCVLKKDDDTFHIFQACGYSIARGLFCDMYKVEEA